MTQKVRSSRKVFKYIGIVGGTFLVYYLFGLIPGSSPLKYVATLVSVGAILHTVQKDRAEAKKKGENPSPAFDKMLAIAALVVALTASVIDDHSKYKTDQASQAKSGALAKSQSDLAKASNKLAELTNENTRKGAAEAAKTRVIASQTKAETVRIKQDDRVIVLDQWVLKALAKQNNKIANQNALEQQRDAMQQEGNARRLSIVTRDQAARTRDADKALALHSDVLQASQSIHSLRETLHGFDRTLNPIRDVRLSYMEIIPLNSPNPQMQAYKALVDKTVQDYQASSPARNTTEITAVGGDYVTEQGSTKNTSRLIFSRGSELYPTNTRSLPGSLFNFPANVGLWHKSSWTKLPNGTIKLISIQPDLILEVAPQAVPELWYYPAVKKLVLAYPNIPVTTDVSTGKITSLPDLEGSWVAVRGDNYVAATQTFSYLGADDEVRSQCVVDRVSLTVSNRFFLFNLDNLRNSFDSSGRPMCTFTFDSSKAYKARALNAADFWENLPHYPIVQDNYIPRVKPPHAPRKPLAK